MQTLIKSLLLATALVSCGTGSDSRYRDISQLERPPTLPSNPNSRPNETYTADDSRIEKSSEAVGLGDKVYLTDASPLQLRIKQPIDKAWYALAQAIKQSNLKINDYNREKRVYYVSSGESSDGFFSFLSSNTKISYVLSMKGSGNETAVMANLAAEQSGASNNPDGVDSSDKQDDNNPEKVLRTLYAILHDDLKLDYNGS
ncbi:MAG: hypothetical protein RIQ94_2980 [Pseudomonadota bacterium]